MKKMLWISMPLWPLSFMSCNTNLDKKLIIMRVHDGDTVYFNNDKKGRLFGIDAPELKNSFFQTTQGIEQSAALRAKSKLSYLLRNKKLNIIKITQDKYGRDIIKIKTPNHDIGILMVKLGMARVAYISNKKKNKFFSVDEEYYKKLLDAQHLAFVNNIGIWSRKELYKKIFPKGV